MTDISGGAFELNKLIKYSPERGKFLTRWAMRLHQETLVKKDYAELVALS